MSTPSLIAIEQVSFSYTQNKQRTLALREIALTIDTGEVFGLLGPNGAGKSTLLGCLTGLMRADAGRIMVGGIDVAQDSDGVKRQLGIQMQKTALIELLTVRELVELYAGLYEVYLTRARIDALLGQFDLVGQADKLARRMSGGQQQRLALALAVANDPQIVVLDEPTESLDPHARRAIWDVLRGLRARGRTVLFSTHQMEEAEQLCDRVAIIDGGRIVACDAPARLIAAHALHATVRTRIDIPLDRASALPGVQSASLAGGYLELATSQPQSTLSALYALAEQAGARVDDVTVRQPSLEDVYLKLTGKASFV